MSGTDDQSRRTLRAMGVTMLGVVLSISTTVGLGLTAPWWQRVLAAVAVAAVLVATIKLATASGGKGLVARAADWITGSRGSDGSSG